MNTCMTCQFATVVPKDFSKRTCRGAPPQLVVVPTPQGPAIQTMFPNVEVNQPACGTYKLKLMTIDKKVDDTPPDVA